MYGRLTQKGGYTNFKNSYLFNHKELEDAPHINVNRLMRTISIWWVYFQFLCLIILNYSIFLGIFCFWHDYVSPRSVRHIVHLISSSPWDFVFDFLSLVSVGGPPTWFVRLSAYVLGQWSNPLNTLCSILLLVVRVCHFSFMDLVSFWVC